MAVVQYLLEYGDTFATLNNSASNLVNVTVNYGRQAQLDQYNANTASVTMRYPNGYASPNASFVTGTWVSISTRLVPNVAWQRLFVGRIDNVTVEYGIPYQGSVGNADYVTLSCEGQFAAFGRVQGNNYAMPAGTLSAQTNFCNVQTGLDITSFYLFGAEQKFPATTISSTWGDWVNRTALTMNGRIIDLGNGIGVANAYYKLNPFYGNFSDTTNNASNHSYDKIAFTSLADNYYTQVTVTPESYSPATVSSGSAPYRTYAVNTLNNSTAQATDYANYLLSTYKTRALRIASVTCNLNAQVGQIPAYGMDYVSTQISVAFRGTTYQCVLEGATFSGTPSSASATFYLSAQDLNNYLLLNDPVYGTLDNNKLGY
jgi:hypothetical protein